MGSRGVSVLAFAVGIAGVVAVSADARAAQCGKAAWYDLDGMTASGERSDGSALAAAHRSLPFGTRVRVENLANGREVVVRVNDRGPFVGGRVIDVTRAAAEKLGMINAGIARVRVSVVDGGGRLDGACGDAPPRVLTADAVAAGASKAKPEVVPSETQTAAVEEPAETQIAAVESPVEIGTAPPAPHPTSLAKPNDHAAGRVLVATVLYDEGTGKADATPTGVKTTPAADAATFTEEPSTDLEDAKIVAAPADVPLPRPRPPVFGGEAPGFNKTLALRFLDAFEPNGSGLPTAPLGYAPMAPRGAVITE